MASRLRPAADTAGVSNAPLARQTVALMESLAPIAEKYFRVSDTQSLLLNAAISMAPTILGLANVASADSRTYPFPPAEARQILADHFGAR